MRYLMLVLSLLPAAAFADSPALDRPLSPLVIADRGELVFDGDDFDYVPWRSDRHPGPVHVLQYFAGTKAASETFAPFTDHLQERLQPGSYHVTTVINLDAALWGTTGFVVSELKDNKRRYPDATMVLDAQGVGASTWQLGKKGALLAIMDADGTVRFLSREPLSEGQIEQQARWLASQGQAAPAGNLSAQ